MQPLFLDRGHPLSARVMMFAVSGYFRDEVAGVSWEVKARRQGIATPAASGHAAGRTGERAGRGYGRKRNNQDANSAHAG